MTGNYMQKNKARSPRRPRQWRRQRRCHWRMRINNNNITNGYLKKKPWLLDTVKIQNNENKENSNPNAGIRLNKQLKRVYTWNVHVVLLYWMNRLCSLALYTLPWAIEIPASPLSRKKRIQRSNECKSLVRLLLLLLRPIIVYRAVAHAFSIQTWTKG